MYDKLVTKVSAIDTKIPSTKIQYDSHKQDLEKKNDDKIIFTREMVKKNGYDRKITEIENKIPSVTVLLTTAAINTKST